MFLTSCQMTVDQDENTELDSRKRISQIWNPHLFFSDLRQTLSFPLWFNKEEVARKGIARLRFLEYAKGDSIGIGEERHSLPIESYQYSFREDGTVSVLTHKTYLNGFCIGESKFRFQDFKAEHGHVEVQTQQLATENFKATGLTKEHGWGIFDLIDTNEISSTFLKRGTNKKIFVVPNSQHWMPLLINKQLNPSPEDVLLLGTPEQPQKIYKVRNIVEESDVTQFFYRKGFIYQVRNEQLPFSSKTTYEYTVDGLCVGFIDSVFSENTLVESKRSIFHYTPDTLPYRVEHLHRTEGGDMRQINVFQYEFRDPSPR